MTHLSAQELIQLEFALSKRHSELLDDISHVLMDSSGAEFIDNINEFLEQDDTSIEHLVTGITLEEIRKYVNELRAIEKAKSRLDNNTYGLCKDCAQAISFNHLLQAPTTLRCDTCLHATNTLKKAG
ncbi:MAG: hypothetical protein OEX19_15770 [Gammaproteobacteria bacterium]|nr:hypothetical protein [Gammaproteobacteria bacterium]